MNEANPTYAARLEIDYPEQLDRLTTFFRLLLAIPIVVILGLVTNSHTTVHYENAGSTVQTASGILGSLFVAAALMILVRQRYPRWWFDFLRELVRFETRVAAYLALLTDRYPSTVDQQSVHLELDYPDVERDLHRGMPLVKWILALPHYFVLIVLIILAVYAVFFAWFAILFTGRYPRVLFDFVVGVLRWCLRVQAYAFLLLTDRYPPFTLA